MKKWTRWEDWVAIAAGAAAMISTLFVPPMGASVALMLTLGALLVVSGIVNLAMPGLVAMEYIQAALGALLLISPWMGGYADAMTFGAAWMSWICGAVALVAAVLAIRPSMQAHHGAVTH